MENLLIGQFNINSTKNKVDMLSYMIQNKIDIIIMSESKLDDAFPTSQLVIENWGSCIEFGAGCKYWTAASGWQETSFVVNGWQNVHVCGF